MENLFRDEVTRKVFYDKRTDWEESKNISLGYPFDVIRDEVLAKGRADFTAGYEDDEFGPLTEEDKVLLYCFVFMKRHFFEALATFRAYRGALKATFDSTRPTVMADLGCGPGTAGLALGECLDEPRVVYLGLDIASAMRNKAKSMLTAARDQSLLDTKSKISTTSSWAQVAKSGLSGLEQSANVLVNATYLFSSDSLDVNDVCKAVMAFKESNHVRRLLFVYSNTTTEVSGEKFRAFKKQLKGEFKAEDLMRCTRTYHKKRSSEATATVEFHRQLLDFKDE